MIAISCVKYCIYYCNHLSLHQQTMIFASKVSETKLKKQISSKLQVLYEINRDDDATVVH